MINNINVTLMPDDFFCKYDHHDSTRCRIKIDLKKDDEVYTIDGSTNDKYIKELISEIDEYFASDNAKKKEAKVIKHVGYPFSFYVDPYHKYWLIRCCHNMELDDFYFTYELNNDDVALMREQLISEYKKLDWGQLGRVDLYTFQFVDKKFEWFYSAKELNEWLNKLVLGKKIVKTFVGAINYAFILDARDNAVFFNEGDAFLIQFEDCLLYFMVIGEGLFQCQYFENNEYKVSKSANTYLTAKDNGDESKFCEVGNFHNALKLDYADKKIEEVTVQKTDTWPFTPYSFDETKVGNPVELPYSVIFRFSNNVSFRIVGDEFEFFFIAVDKVDEKK